MGAQHFVRGVTVACVLAALIAPAGASAAKFYVDGAVAASGDCLSPAAACKTLADAIPKERGTTETDTINVAAGTYVESINLNMAGDGGLAIVGAGAGTDPSTNTLLESTSGLVPVVEAQAPDSLLALRNLRVVVTGSGTGQGITGAGAALALGSADGPLVVDMANPGNSAPAISTGGPQSSTSTLDHVTVGGTWTGNALFGGRNTTVTDSYLRTGQTTTASPILLDGPGTALFQRSVLQTGNPSAMGVIVSGTKIDVVIDSSEVLGGSGVYLSSGGAGQSHTLTVASSTLDAGVLGNRDDAATYPDVTTEASGSGAAVTARIDGSILTEAPKATVSSGGTASIACTSTDVASTSQAASASLGAIDCPSGSNGNTFTPSLSSLFASPAPDYTLNPSSSAVDTVPESAIVLPSGFSASGTDLAGAPRVVNGVATCAGPIRDKGALELAGHSGVVPAAVIAAPPAADAGSPVAFAGSAPNEPGGTPLTFDWQFSDGTTASGQNVSHAFGVAGAAAATLTVTAPGGCVGTAMAPLTISTPLLAQLTLLKLRPGKFRAAGRGGSLLRASRKKPPVGTRVSYRDSEAATTTFTVQRAKRGVKRGARCVKRTRKNKGGKRCTRWVAVKGSFSHLDTVGANSLRFTGRLRRRKLSPGSYRLSATPAIGTLVGKRVRARFSIVR